MICPVYKYTTADKLIAAVLAIVMLALCIGSLNYGCIWGDDSAAYISEGIAIANGNFKEHVKLNPLLHPSKLGENVGDELVYAWGYPLLLSLVYLADGFDMDNYSNIILYKLPSAVFFAVMAVCFFLLLRRRFSLAASVFTTCFFCTASMFFDIVNSLYSDVVYTGMCMLTLLWIEPYMNERSRRALVFKGVILGILLWYTAEVRTNGMVFIAVLLAAQIDALVSRKSFGKAEILTGLIPYAVFIVLKAVTEYILLRPATNNSADMTIASSDIIFANILFYTVNLAEFARAQFYNLFASVLMFFAPVEKLETASSALYIISEALAWGVLAAAALGIITDGLKKNRYLTFYLVICAAGTCLLPFTQGLRYMMGIMPVMALFSVYGCRWLFAKTAGRKKKDGVRKSNIQKAAIGIITAAACIAVCSAQYRVDAKNISQIRTNGADIHAGSEGMYSPEAIEIYDYIKAYTPTDAVFAFHKPRALYLNTGRLGFSYLVNDRDAADADYCILPELFYRSYADGEAPEWFSQFEIVVYNDELTLMKKVPVGE